MAPWFSRVENRPSFTLSEVGLVSLAAAESLREPARPEIILLIR
jgi:hypothetical protein